MILAGLASLVILPAAAAQGVPRPPIERDRLIGKDARGLIQMLGAPTQDIREGPARRLQFSSAACILDVYLYPAAEGQTPLAIYATARVPDGRDADRNSCVTALQMRRQQAEARPAPRMPPL